VPLAIANLGESWVPAGVSHGAGSSDSTGELSAAQMA
jgi:hypothetical protein